MHCKGFDVINAVSHINICLNPPPSNQNLKREVAVAQPDMQKLNRDLEITESLCSSLQQGYQEYCPDIRRQEAQVKNLQTRYANINNQLGDRYVTAVTNIHNTQASHVKGGKEINIY